ncbi:MarR family winged helix-turn-helix transcriptional regulator [Roseomonas rosulenta]|uniref:MarR family winged helix-turn-helix transcriptional regulator n=1 Tax=Roseomonas rosulenta TaxID=2748667 RepID=UPI0018DF944F|nr:MarR family winged helix-turn-helix transcriptional regulator [Roseomonas rosulenta]
MSSFDLYAFLPYRLSVASNLVSRLFARRYAEEFGLTIAEWRVMAVVGADGTASAAAVRARTGMDKAKVSRAVAGLLERRLVKRIAHPGDRRLEPLALTSAGRATFEAIVPRARALEAELADGLSAGERAALEAALRHIAARAEALGAASGGGPD